MDDNMKVAEDQQYTIDHQETYVLPGLGGNLDEPPGGWIRYVKHMGSDLDVVRSARVSYNAAWRSGENEGADEKLINYLIRKNHTSPFEHCSITFEVQCPLFIRSQWHRHRTQSYSEISARYARLDLGYYEPHWSKLGVQSKDNKQVREMLPEMSAYTDEQMTEMNNLVQSMNIQNRMAFETYETLLNEGVPTELARIVLPQATFTRFFTTLNLHNLLHFLGLRLHEHAQYEIRVYALEMLRIAKRYWPVTVAAWQKHKQPKG